MGMPKILIIDDIKANVRLLEKYLSREYQCFTAFDGTTGLNKAMELNPDLILLDILLPDIDGYEVLSRLKSHERTMHIPIVFLTSLNDIQDETKGLEMGAVDYLVKPFRIPIIMARVKNHIALKQTRDLLEDLASIDGLTGIPNRRNFDTTLSNEWNRNARQETPLSLILMDIDFFKKYNDHYGHTNGDVCLQKVAQAMKESLTRASDFIARYGGEEFAAILPCCDMDSARQSAFAIKNAVSNLAIPHAQSKVAPHVTLSLGLATQIPEPGSSPQEFIQSADQALYRAKNMGRNTIQI